MFTSLHSLRKETFTHDPDSFCFAYRIKYSETSIKRTPLRDLPSVLLIESVRLIRVVKIAQCLLRINIQRLLCTVIKLHVVKEAIQSLSSLPFIINFNLFVNAKTLTDFSTYFKDVIQYYYCQFSPVST